MLYTSDSFHTGLSILQNGKVPQFLDEPMIQQIFFSGNPEIDENDSRTPISELRRGLMEMGIIQVTIFYTINLKFKKSYKSNCK